MELVSIHKDVIESGFGLEYFLRGASHETVQGLHLVDICHVHIELGLALSVKVIQRQGVGAEQGGAVH